MTFFDYLKNIFLVIIILQLAPPLLENMKKQYGKYLLAHTKVGVIEIKGIISNSDTYNKQLQTYFKDPSIKAILLKIECPGGASGSSQAIYNEILALKKEYVKPLVTLVENVCTSGGYYIACASDFIIAPGSALVGSVGTSIPYLFKVNEFLEQFKIHYESAKAGTYKNITNPFVPATSEDRVLVQSLLDDAYQQFAQDVAARRKLPVTTVTTWADGKIFTAKQAHNLGLIDAIGSAHTAVGIIKEKALIEGEIEWIRKQEPSGFAKFFGSEEDHEGDSVFSLMVRLSSHFMMTLLPM